MRKNRFIYLCLLLSMTGLLLVFSKPYLLVGILFLLGLAVLMAVLLWRDAGKIEVALEIRSGEQVGRALPLRFTVHSTGRLRAVRSVSVDLEVRNTMFRTVQRHRFLLRMVGSSGTFEIPLQTELCGETYFHCTRIQAQDLMNLFSRPCSACPGARTMVYPHSIQVRVLLSSAQAGIPQADGLMQNRRGTDPSEMFEMREYVPGDDIRSIHWKLSSKMDTLILRQASAPSHYYIALMPDFGLLQDGQEPSAALRNGAVALGIAIGEQLVRQGMVFCLLLPSDDRLYLCEVRNLPEFHHALAQWLSLPVRQESGAGPRFFLSEHLEQSFTRLILLSAGRYSGDLNALDSQVGVTVVSAVDSETALYAKLSGTRDVVEIPAVPPSKDEVFRILC